MGLDFGPIQIPAADVMPQSKRRLIQSLVALAFRRRSNGPRFAFQRSADIGDLPLVRFLMIRRIFRRGVRPPPQMLLGFGGGHGVYVRI